MIFNNRNIDLEGAFYTLAFILAPIYIPIYIYYDVSNNKKNTKMCIERCEGTPEYKNSMCYCVRDGEIKMLDIGLK